MPALGTDREVDIINIDNWGKENFDNFPNSE